MNDSIIQDIYFKDDSLEMEKQLQISLCLKQHAKS